MNEELAAQTLFMGCCANPPRDLAYAKDALGRLTNMVDASGTTAYTYAVGGGREIISEDGPWSGDVLTVTNRQGRRLGLQLTQPTGNA